MKKFTRSLHSIWLHTHNIWWSSLYLNPPCICRTSLFIVTSLVYAIILIVVCIAYVISDVTTHRLPVLYYESFFTYLYGVSILFLLYVFCFLLQGTFLSQSIRLLLNYATAYPLCSLQFSVLYWMYTESSCCNGGNGKPKSPPKEKKSKKNQNAEATDTKDEKKGSKDSGKSGKTNPYPVKFWILSIKSFSY